MIAAVFIKGSRDIRRKARRADPGLIPGEEIADVPAQPSEGVAGLFPGVPEPIADGPALLLEFPSGLLRQIGRAHV